MIESPKACSFAMFRMPESDEVTLIRPNDGSEPLCFTGIESLNGCSGFVIAPFAVDAAHPIVLIRPDHIERFRIEWESSKGVHSDVYSSEPRNSYREAFRSFQDALSTNLCQKLVLSRESGVTTSGDVDVVSIFTEACRRYHHSYVYMINTPQTGLWIGSTPEVLLRGSEGCYTSMSLAGTQPAPADDNLDSVVWNEKNRHEQSLVTSYLATLFSSNNIPFQYDGPRTVPAGELVHLRTDFHFTLSKSDTLGSLLNKMHPTPAVCGLPKATAYKYILSHEGYNREYYSGFLGMLNPDGESSIFVNLRCMKVDADVVRLYAGGGILPDSELYDEWMETERKMATMKRIIRSK